MEKKESVYLDGSERPPPLSGDLEDFAESSIDEYDRNYRGIWDHSHLFEQYDPRKRYPVEEMEEIVDVDSARRSLVLDDYSKPGDSRNGEDLSKPDNYHSLSNEIVQKHTFSAWTLRFRDPRIERLYWTSRIFERKQSLMFIPAALLVFNSVYFVFRYYSIHTAVDATVGLITSILSFVSYINIVSFYLILSRVFKNRSSGEFVRRMGILVCVLPVAMSNIATSLVLKTAPNTIRNTLSITLMLFFRMYWIEGSACLFTTLCADVYLKTKFWTQADFLHQGRYFVYEEVEYFILIAFCTAILYFVEKRDRFHYVRCQELWFINRAILRERSWVEQWLHNLFPENIAKRFLFYEVKNVDMQDVDADAGYDDHRDDSLVKEANGEISHYRNMTLSSKLAQYGNKKKVQMEQEVSRILSNEPLEFSIPSLRVLPRSLDDCSEFIEGCSIFFLEVLSVDGDVIRPDSSFSIWTELFTQYDSAMDIFGFHKLKTVLNTYIGFARSQPVEMSCVLSLCLLEIARKHKAIVRIGLSTNASVYSGVIGTERYQWDLLGDDMNLTSRLLDSALPDSVHIDERTANALKENHDNRCSERAADALISDSSSPTLLSKPLAAIKVSPSEFRLFGDAGPKNNVSDHFSFHGMVMAVSSPVQLDLKGFGTVKSCFLVQGKNSQISNTLHEVNRIAKEIEERNGVCGSNSQTNSFVVDDVEILSARQPFSHTFRRSSVPSAFNTADFVVRRGALGHVKFMNAETENGFQIFRRTRVERYFIMSLVFNCARAICTPRDSSYPAYIFNLGLVALLLGHMVCAYLVIAHATSIEQGVILSQLTVLCSTIVPFILSTDPFASFAIVRLISDAFLVIAVGSSTFALPMTAISTTSLFISMYYFPRGYVNFVYGFFWLWLPLIMSLFSVSSNMDLRREFKNFILAQRRSRQVAYEAGKARALLSSLLPLGLIASLPLAPSANISNSLSNVSELIDGRRHHQQQQQTKQQQTKQRKHNFGPRYSLKYEFASVLFADFVGTTSLARQMKEPKLFFTLLSRLVDSFDQVAHVVGALPVAVIGDCYVCYSFDENHQSQAILNMAYGILSLLEDLVQKHWNIDISVRVGVASGPLMGRIGISQKRSVYEISGEAREKSHRFERNGIPNHVIFSPATLSHFLNRSESNHQLSPEQQLQRLFRLRDNVQMSEDASDGIPMSRTLLADFLRSSSHAHIASHVDRLVARLQMQPVFIGLNGN